MEDDAHAVAVRQWVRSVIVGLDFCPWAGPAESAGRVRVVTSAATSPLGVLEDLRREAERLPPAPSSDKEELPPGAATTTLLVCPHVEEWEDFSAFQDFYAGPLVNGYAFADLDLYVVPFHPHYGEAARGCAGIAAGDRLELGEGPGGEAVVALVLDANAGFGEAGQRLAKVQIEGTGQECLICLPPAASGLGGFGGGGASAIVSRAPRPVLHLLRTPDLERAEDPGLRARNHNRVAGLGEVALESMIRRCG